MDQFTVETTEEPKKTESAPLFNQDSPDNPLEAFRKPVQTSPAHQDSSDKKTHEAPEKSVQTSSNQDLPDKSPEAPPESVQTSLSHQDSPHDLPSSDNFSDIFGDTFGSSNSAGDPSELSTKPCGLFFTLEEDSEDTTPLTWNLKRDNLALDSLEKAANDQGISTSSSLFDDLMDISTPGTTEMDRILQDNMTDPKPVSNVDLLLGVDDDLDSLLGLHSEVKNKTPDILDFVDVPHNLPEVSSMDITGSLTCEPLSDGWNLISDVSASSKKQTPDIVVTSSCPVPDLDEADGGITKKKQEEEKTDENVSEKTDENIKDDIDGNINKKTVEIASMEYFSSKTDSTKELNQEIDFSVLELPEASNLNFDHFKHKRNISQKGSIANRKKPKRSTIQPHSEDSIFVDSTEPKPQKLQTEDEPDTELRPDDIKGDNTQETDSEVNEEASPSRKFAGSIKIPGLLEGLSKSKVFNKTERKSPVTEADNVPQVSNLVSETRIDPASKAASSTVVTSSSPVILPKPVLLPRVLPKPATKTLKDTQNQTTADGGVVRASSFRNKSSDSVIAEQFSPLKGQTALSRSASVKVAHTESELSLLRERKTSPFGISKLLPPKPELKKPLSPPASKTVNKTPPPVPAKPSVAAKPRLSLGLSASFSGGKSPLLSALKSESKTESSSIAEGKPNSGITVNVEKKAESNSIINTSQKPIGVNMSIDDKPVLSSFSSNKKPLSFAQKSVKVPYENQKDVEVHGQKTVELHSGGQKSVELHSVGQKSVELNSGVQKNVEIHSGDQKSVEKSAELHSDGQKNVELNSGGQKSVELNSGGLKSVEVHSKSQKSVEVHSRGQKSVDFHSEGQKNSDIHTEGDKTVAEVSSPAAPEKLDIAEETVNSSSGESQNNVTVTRIASLKMSHSGFVTSSRFKGYKNLEEKKTESSDADDVFDKSDSSTSKTSRSASIQDSSSSGEKFDSTNIVDENFHHRKSSISGITSVKSPLANDKPTSSILPRKNSITGSAYNPIGFRSTLGSSDSEQRSRGSSFSSAFDVTSVSSSVNFLPSVTASSPEVKEDSFDSSGGQKSKEGFSSSAHEQVRHSPEKSLANSPAEAKTKSGTLRDTKLTPVFTPKGGDDKRKEAANATNRDIKEQTKILLEANSPSTVNGNKDVAKAGVSSDKKSPWNIQLKKVEKKEPLPKPEPASKPSESPVNWRQQLSVRQKNIVPPKDSEKPEQDSTPDWAKASIKRRQRLIESGVIRGDS